MADTPSFIVLEGRLHENNDFELERGYELRSVPTTDRRNHFDAGLVARLVDQPGRTLVEGLPKAGIPQGCSRAPNPPGIGSLRAVLPRHADAARIELWAGERNVFKATVGSDAPSITGVTVTTDGGAGQFFFELAKPKVDDIQAFLVDSTGRRFPLGPATPEQPNEVDLSPYAGRGSASVLVVASNDFRSDEAQSDPFDLPRIVVIGRIVAPFDGAEHPPGMRGSLIGNLSDKSGRPILWDPQSTSWVLDGTPLQDHRSIAGFDALEPGKHEVELVYTREDGQTVILDQVDIKVREATAAEKEYELALAAHLKRQA